MFQKWLATPLLVQMPYRTKGPERPSILTSAVQSLDSAPYGSLRHQHEKIALPNPSS